MPKTGVVTGGGNGIGYAISMELAKRGYRVVVADIAVGEALAAVADIEEGGGTAMGLRCDVTSPDEVRLLVETTAATYGVPDLVFSNAGAGLAKAVTEHSRSDLQWLFELNVFGMWDVATSFINHAHQVGRGTRIVLTGSEHSIGLPHEGMGAYTATKHAILGFADVLRSELAEQASGVSVLCPGLIKSRLWEGERHRKDKEGEADPATAAVMEAGMPPAKVAMMAVDGAERGDFYIFTHSHSEEYCKHRFAEITQAFKVLNASHPSDRSYDLNLIAGELLAGGESTGPMD